MSDEPHRFRPAFGRVLTVVIVAIAALGFSGLIVDGDLAGILRGTPWFAALGLLAWSLFWAPFVDISDEHVVVRNPLRSWRIDWGSIQRIDTKWTLTLDTPRGRIEAWATPAPGRFTVFRMGPDDARVSESARVAGTIRPGDTLSSESGAAAETIRRRWELLRDRGELDALATTARVDATWNSRTLAAFAVLALACALSVIL